MQTKNAIGNLINRYCAVLKKCNILNTFGTLAIAGMFVMCSAGVASAENVTITVANSEEITTIINQANLTKLTALDTFKITADGTVTADVFTSISSPLAVIGNFVITGATKNVSLSILNQTMTVDGITTLSGANTALGILDLDAGGVFVSKGGTTAGAFSIINLTGTHEGNLTLNASTAKLEGNGGTVTGNLNVTQGKVEIKNLLVIKGNMVLAKDSDLSFDSGGAPVLEVTGNLTLGNAYAGGNNTVDVHKTVTLGGAYALTNNSLDADTLVFGATGDVTVSNGRLSLNQDITIVNADTAATENEFIFATDATGSVTANTVTIATAAGATRTAGVIIADKLIIADTETTVMTFNGATPESLLLRLNAEQNSSDLGVDAIKLTKGVVILGASHHTSTVNDANMVITLDAAVAGDATLQLAGGTFSIKELNSTNGTITAENIPDTITETLNVGTFNIGVGTTTVSSGILNVTGTTFKIETGEILAITGGTVDLSAVGTDVKGGQINVSGHGTLQFNDLLIPVSEITYTPADNKLCLNGEGFLQAKSITLSVAGSNVFSTHSNAGIRTDTAHIMNGDNLGTLEIVSGILKINGNGAESTFAEGITLNANFGEETSTLYLGENGGFTSAAINVTKGTFNVDGDWTLHGDITTGNASVIEVNNGSLSITNDAGVVLGGTTTLAINNGSLATDKITLSNAIADSLNIMNGSMAVTGALNSSATAANEIIINNSTLTVGQLILNKAQETTLIADNSTITIAGKTAGDFESKNVTLNNASTLIISQEALLATDTTLHADIGKISSDGSSTIHITGDTNKLSITNIKELQIALIKSGEVAFIKADGLDVSEDILSNGSISSGTLNDSGVDISGQAGNTSSVFVASGDVGTTLTNFVAAGIIVDSVAVDINIGTVKLTGNDIVKYINGTDKDAGKLVVATEGTLILAGASAGKLASVKLTDATTNTTKLLINGSYDITTIAGTTANKNSVDILGGNLAAGTLSNATVTVAGGDLNVDILTNSELNATTKPANISLVSVSNSTLTFGGTALVTRAGFGANVVNATIHSLAPTAATTIKVDTGAMVAIGSIVDKGIVSSDWIATSMQNANLTFGTGEGMVASAFGVASALDLTASGANHILNVGANTATAGQAAFGKNSLFIVDAGGVDKNTALTVNNMLTVAEDAKLLITNVVLTDGEATVKIAAGLNGVTVMSGAWGNQDAEGTETLIFDNIFLKGTDASIYNTNGVTIDIEQILASDAFGTDIDSSLGDLIDKAVAGGFTNKFVNETSGTANTLEGGAKLGTVAGIAPSLNAVGAAGLSNMQARNSITGASSVAVLNYSGDTLIAAADGVNMETGIGIWAMPMYKITNASDLKSGSFKYGYDTNFYGVSIGADYTFDLNSESTMRLGVTFNTGSGTTDSTGDFADTANDFSYYGFGVYGTRQMDNFAISADFTYTSSNNDITQNTVGSNLTANPNANLMSFGVRGEYLVPTGAIDIVPYLGLRWNSNTIESYDSNFKNETAFSTKEQTATVIEIPLGLSLRKEIEMNNSSITPKLDLGIKYATGDLDTTQEITLPGVTGIASMDSTAMDALTFQGGLGVAFKAGSAMSFDLDYKLEISSSVMNNGVFGTFRYTF